MTATRTLLKKNISKFGSLISILALITMLTLFSLFIPEMIASVAGRVFVVLWAVIAIGAFIAHVRTIKSVERRPSQLKAMLRKEEHTRKRIRPERFMREL